jgi:protocatechuate 3,4-dioxygenase beta subunit
MGETKPVYASVKGSVSDGNTPLANVLVALEGLSLSMLTDNKGEFAFKDITPGTYNLKLSKDKYDPVTKPNIALPATFTAHDLGTIYMGETKPVYASVKGSVSDGNTPLANVLVALEGLSLSMLTDNKGEFAFKDLAPGTYTLKFTKDLYDPAVKPNVAFPATFTVHDLGTFTMNKAKPRYASIMGTVSSQGPLAGVEISFTNGETVFQHTTDEYGTYYFMNVEPGKYILRATKDGYHDYEASETINIGNIQHDITLTKPIVAVTEKYTTELKDYALNPANGEVTIKFSLERTATVNLEIFDVQKNKVRSLTTSSFAGGEHSLVWDGKDDKGTQVKSDIYLYRMTTTGYLTEKRMLYVK